MCWSELLSMLSGIPKDKLLHFFCGALIGLSGIISVPLGILLVVAAAIGKELWDYISKKGTPEVADVLWTLFGGCCSLLPSVF